MSLVNELVKGLLPEEEKKVVAVYGGGFKPPTKGHFEVVKQAIKENPNIDEFVINIGGKARDGVTPEESIQIWDIYKQYLPVSANINIQYSSTPPIKATYDYAKNHPDEEVLFILGAREGNEDDFKDISSRTKSLDKYPNLNLRTIVTKGGVSGTAARNAGKISKEKIRPFLPDELKDEEVEEIYQMVSDKVTENISESKQVGTLYHYTSANGLKGILQSNSIKASEEYYLGNDLYFVSFTRNKNFHKKGSAFDVSMDYRIALDGNKLSNKYKITPFAYIPGWNYKDNWEYDWLDDEPESVVRDFLNASGDYDEQEERINFKKPGSSITNIKDYILKIDKVSELTEGRKKKKDPKKGTGKKPEGSGRRLYTDEDPKDTVGIKFSTRQDIVDTLNKKSFKAKSHARQSQIINLIHQRTRAAYNRAKDPKVKKRLKTALDYITKRKEASKKKTQRLKNLKENATYSQHIDIIEKIAELTNYMIESGLNIEPLPSMEFIDGDTENAKDFFGKTAYYDPNKQHIVLYTEGRHPKDILRSYAHEMIHHIQYLEDRLHNITTTNTNEDEDLDAIEKEAYVRGNMTFRNWTDSITGDKLEENLNNPNLTKQLKNYIEDYTDININLLKDLLKIKNKYPKQLDPRVGGNKFGYRGTTFSKEFIDKLKVKSKVNGVTEYEVPPNLKINSRGKRGFLSFSTDEEVAKGFGHYSGYVDYKKSDDRVGGYVKVSLDNPNFIIHPDYMGELSKDMEYSKDNEKETLYVGNSFTPESIFVIDKDIYDTLTEGKKKDPFGLLAYAQELGRLREEESEYKVYLDMDGVLADFDQRFRDISGMEPKDFENKYGTKEFWNLIDEENKIKFWVGIPVMSGAADLVDAVKDYNYELLTSPSAKKQSYLGKILWVKNHTGDVFPSKPRINFKKAKEKHLVKPQLAKTDILIDDREDTIGRWNASGGTGIVYKSIGQVLGDLKKLGL